MSQTLNKEWMNERNRISEVYTNGVASFLNFAIANNGHQFSTFPCPCVKCQNKKRFTAVDIKGHLIMHGIDRTYTKWVLHGETLSSNLTCPAVEPIDCEGHDEADNNENERLQNLVDACYGVHEQHCVEPDQEGFSEKSYVDNKKYNQYNKLAIEKLYPSCEGPETTLSAIVELHNLKKQFGWSGNSVTALLSIVKRWLPKENTLPEKYPQMKRMMTDLGMKANYIHACENNCILYWKENEDLEECP